MSPTAAAAHAAATAAPMARLTKAEVLRRYQAGDRDFRGADLRSLRFRGACLAGADFSSADLRGTDFLDTDLRGVKFVGCRCGLPLVRWLGQGVVGLGMGVGAVIASSYGILVMCKILFDAQDSIGAHRGWLVSIGIGLFCWQG